VRVNPLDPVGAVVAGVRVDALPDQDVTRMRQLLAEHGVLVLRSQDADDGAFVRFLRSFGDLTFTTGETPVDGFPDLNVITNVGRTTPPRSTFHVDTSYVRRPPAYTALRAVDIPERGGHTVFSDQYRAYDTLDDELRSLVAGRSIDHVVTGVEPAPGEQTRAAHPVAAPHPLSGRTALYLTTPARCASVSGMSDEDGKALVHRLFEHSTREGNLLRHRWAPGDVVIWDNRCVMHKADHSGVVGRRVLHRGLVLAP
jgi:taurine dioxygenase